jgi:hypothetical protein
VSVALWPVFEDQHPHDLVDEGAVLLDVGDRLDALAEKAGRTPLSSFDAYVEVPEDVVADRVLAGDGIPDLSDYPVSWHDPADAVATLDTLLAVVGSTRWRGEHDRGLVLDCLTAVRTTLSEAISRQTRFHFTIA